MDSIIQMLESISNISLTISSISSSESEACLAWEIHTHLKTVLGIIEDYKESELLAIEASLT